VLDVSEFWMRFTILFFTLDDSLSHSMLLLGLSVYFTHTHSMSAYYVEKFQKEIECVCDVCLINCLTTGLTHVMFFLLLTFPMKL